MPLPGAVRQVLQPAAMQISKMQLGRRCRKHTRINTIESLREAAQPALSPKGTLRWSTFQGLSEARFRLSQRRFLQLNQHFQRFFRSSFLCLHRSRILSIFKTCAQFLLQTRSFAAKRAPAFRWFTHFGFTGTDLSRRTSRAPCFA